jgi:hypothetical protein
MKKTSGELFVEYERLYKEAETAHNIWSQYDEYDSFSKEALRAFKTWNRAEEKRNKAFRAYHEAATKEMGEHYESYSGMD